MRISDWSSDVCSSDLAAVSGIGRGIELEDHRLALQALHQLRAELRRADHRGGVGRQRRDDADMGDRMQAEHRADGKAGEGDRPAFDHGAVVAEGESRQRRRSEEHTSELQSLMRISYAVFCWKTKTNTLD